MSERSDFILGDYVFIKVISLDEERGIRLSKALLDKDLLPPFTSNEFLMNYLINQDNNIILDNVELPSEYNKLLSPGNIVMVSGTPYSLDQFEQYKSVTYSESINKLKANFSPFADYISNIKVLSNQGKYVRTALIISKRITGNYDDFLKKYNRSSEYEKLVTDSLIHISYLYHMFQKLYQSVHGDPKIQNYTWLELERPIDIIYDFRDEYDSTNVKVIKRLGVKHIFYLTDLEFVYSPILKTVNINDNTYYFNFYHQTEWYDTNNVENIIYVPKISSSLPYELNFNLYGGYDVPLDTGIFPRMYTIDLLTLVKMFLTYWYIDTLNSDTVRKLNIYFSNYITISHTEVDPYQRNKSNYITLSPASLAQLFNS